jgi:hypothetical protein
MKNYILERLRLDGLHLLNSSINEEKVKHHGLRGRFRELLIENILSPWLPPYVLCGTGTIIANNYIKRKFTQDDIILFDSSLTPPILASKNLREGVFLYNSVLARIEVKSTVKNKDLRKFCSSSLELSNMAYSVHSLNKKNFTAPFNLFFAYSSDAKNNNKNFEIKRLKNAMNELGISPLSGLVSMICIPGKGFWKLGEKFDGTKTWQKLNSDRAEDHIAWFTGCISNSCFNAHLERQGRDPSQSLEGGIGMYLDHPFSDIDIDNL